MLNTVAGGEELGDLPPGHLLQREAEDASGGKEIEGCEQHRDIVAEGGSEAHAEHAPFQDFDIDQVQGNIGDGHSEHRRDQQVALSGNLQERNQHQGTHGPGRADDEAGQVVFGHAVEGGIGRACAHQAGNGIPEYQHNRQKEKGKAERDRYGGGIPGVRLLLQAAAEGFAAGHLNPGSQHAAQRPDNQQNRIGIAIGGDCCCAEITGNHDIVNQKAEGDG